MYFLKNYSESQSSSIICRNRHIKGKLTKKKFVPNNRLHFCKKNFFSLLRTYCLKSECPGKKKNKPKYLQILECKYEISVIICSSPPMHPAQGLSLFDLLPKLDSPTLIRWWGKKDGLKNLRCYKPWDLPVCCSSQTRWPKFSHSWLIPPSLGHGMNPFPLLQSHITICSFVTNYHRLILTICRSEVQILVNWVFCLGSHWLKSGCH